MNSIQYSHRTVHNTYNSFHENFKAKNYKNHSACLRRAVHHDEGQYFVGGFFLDLSKIFGEIWYAGIP